MTAVTSPVAATSRDARALVPSGRSRAARVARALAGVATAAVAPAMLVAAALQASAWRDYRLSDSVAYSDLSDAVAGGALLPPVSGYWSPLYPWLIGIARRLLAPFDVVDVRAAHVVNVALFAAALLALARLLAHAGRVAPTLRRGAPGWWIAHAAFLWATLRTGVVAQMTPDLLVVALTLATVATAGPLVTGATPAGGAWWRRAAAVGAVAGVGYLAKAALLPIGAVTLLAVAATVRPWRRGVATAATMLGVAACVALPQLVAVSRYVGRPTFGETGRLNYGWFVGEQVLSPVHTAPALRTDPTVLDTDRGRPGTYPPWYDVSRWRHDVRTDVRPARQLAHAAEQGAHLVRIAWLPLLLLAVAILLRARHDDAHAPVDGAGRDASPGRLALVVAAATGAAFGMYVLVLVHPRYVAAPLALAGVGLALLTASTGRVAAWRAALAGAVLLALGLLQAGERARDLPLAVAAVLVVDAVARRDRTVALLALAALAFACDRTQSKWVVAAAVTTVLVASLPAWRRAGALEGRHVARAMALVTVLVLGGDVVRRVTWNDRRGDPTGLVPDAVARARALRAAGLAPGTRIATLGKAWETYWARDGRLRVMAELPDSVVPRYHVDPTVRARVDSTLARHGVRALVAQDDPRAVGPGWRAIDGELALHVVAVPPAR